MGSIKLWDLTLFLWIYSGLLRNLFPPLNVVLYLLPFILAFIYLITSRARHNSVQSVRNVLIIFTIFSFGFQVIHFFYQNISLRNVFTGLVLYSLAPTLIFLCLNTDSRILLLRLVQAIKIGIPINLLLTFLQVIGNFSFFQRSQINGLENMTTDGKVLRAIGTFSHPVGFSTFLSVATVVVFYMYRQKSKQGQIIWIFQIATLYLLSGSRTVYINLFLIMLMYLFIKLKGGYRTKRTVSKVIFSILIPIWFVYLLIQNRFTWVIDAFTNRLVTAAGQENSIQRIITQSLGWVSHLQDSIWGQGLGFFSNSTIGFSVNRSTWVEDDLLKVILEAGSLFGIIVIVFRWALPIYIFVKIGKDLSDENEIVLLLLAAIFTNLTQGALTGQGSVALQVWLIAGICLSSIHERKYSLT
jgi:hypothetical protein